MYSLLLLTTKLAQSRTLPTRFTSAIRRPSTSIFSETCLTPGKLGNVVFAVKKPLQTEDSRDPSQGFKYLYAWKQCLVAGDNGGYFAKRSFLAHQVTHK